MLFGFLLWDLTAFRGDYLTLIAGGHQSSITPPLEILLLGAFVAAAFLLPLSALGLEAAVGLLLSTFARSRQTASLIQIVLTVARVCWPVVPVFLFTSLTSFIVNGQPVPDVRTLLALLANGAAGDWGLGMMHTATVDTIWANVPYSAYIGLALLGMVMLHSGLTALILRGRHGAHKISIERFTHLFFALCSGLLGYNPIDSQPWTSPMCSRPCRAMTGRSSEFQSAVCC